GSYFQYQNEDGSHHVFDVMTTSPYKQHKQRILVHALVFYRFYRYRSVCDRKTFRSTESNKLLLLFCAGIISPPPPSPLPFN
ncbi:hypothetical protein, partial [Nostoc sp. NMS4]|uniref:hypothetical protein n=1 Tax=Nostoc sp. NMS4 TaxID=2815390 RepID=UPI0025E02E4F